MNALMKQKKSWGYLDIEEVLKHFKKLFNDGQQKDIDCMSLSD